MKKYFSALCIAAMGFALAACNPEGPIEGGDETLAPVLGEIAGCVLDNAGEDIVVDYSAADFGTSAVINYALFVDQAGKDMATKQEVKATAKDGKLTISQLNLNNAILALGAEVGAEVNVDFCLIAYLGSTIGTASLQSNIVSAKFTTCVAETIDYDTYKYLYAIGTFNGWAWEEAKGDGKQQYLYDYDGNDVYTGTLFFNGTAHQGWKISGVTGSWDDSCNWGFDENGDDRYLVGTDPIDEFTLQCSGGSKDMKAWSRNFAVYTFDKANLKLKLKTIVSWDKKEYGVQFDYVMLTGSFCEWAETTDGGAVKMNYDPSMHRFYGDITVADGAQIKMFAPNANYDNKWHLQWGNAGGNIEIAQAGNYRIYLDTNKDSYSVVADKYGVAEEHGIDSKDFAEPVVMSPEPSVWTVVGSFNDWAKVDEADSCVLAELAHHDFVYYGLELAAGAELKVRGDHAWDESYGAADGGNVVVEEAGVYDIYFNYDDKSVSAKLCGAGWSVIGVVEGYSWTKDFEMTEGETGVFTSAPLAINGAFKIRYRHSWDGCIGAAESNDKDGNDSVYKLTVGEAAAATTDAFNFCVPEAGTYKVTYDSNNQTVLLETAFPAAVYMNGGSFSSDWSWDKAGQLIPVNGTPGQFWLVRYLEAGSEFKFNTNKAWDGGETPSYGEAVGFTTPGNGKVEAAGLYMIMVDFVGNKTVIEPAKIYGIGDCFGSWDAATYPFTVAEDGKASIAITNAAQLRMYAAAPTGYSIDWWRMEFIFYADGVIAYRGNGGDQERYAVEAGKTVTLDFNAGTGSIN